MKKHFIPVFSLLILITLASCIISTDMGLLAEYRVEAYTTNKTISRHSLISSFEALGLNHYTSTGEMIKISTALFQTDPAFSFCKQISPDSLVVDTESSLSFSTDGLWVYFAANNCIYRVSPEGTELQKMTDEYDQIYANPKISLDGRYLSCINITSSSNRKVYLKDLQTGSIYEYSSGTPSVKNAVFRAESQRLYYVTNTGLYSAGLSDNNPVQEVQFSPDGRLDLTSDDRFIVTSSTKIRDKHRVYFLDLAMTFLSYIDVYDYSLAKSAPVLVQSDFRKALYYNYESGTERVAYSKELDGEAIREIGKIAVNWDGTKIFMRVCYP